jgi:hypothetical protein
MHIVCGKAGMPALLHVLCRSADGRTALGCAAVQVSAWDSIFVRARRRDVHPILADIAGYGGWWPGASTTPDGAGWRLLLRPPTLGARLVGRTQALHVRVRRVRRDLGVELDYRGTIGGAAEWYYLDERAGTVVHYLLKGEAAGGRTLAEHRAAVRAALHELKDRLEAGRAAGAEPDPALLAHQRRGPRSR